MNKIFPLIIKNEKGSLVLEKNAFLEKIYRIKCEYDDPSKGLCIRSGRLSEVFEAENI